MKTKAMEACEPPTDGKDHSKIKWRDCYRDTIRLFLQRRRRISQAPPHHLAALTFAGPKKRGQRHGRPKTAFLQAAKVHRLFAQGHKKAEIARSWALGALR
jgi:hypothetical protein